MLLVGLVGLAAVLVVVGLAEFALSKDQVAVSGLQLTSQDDACRVAGQDLNGFVVNEGTAVHETLTIHNSNISFSCTISSVTPETSGFTVVDANTPVTVPPQTSQPLSFTIQTPDRPYSGALTLDIE